MPLPDIRDLIREHAERLEAAAPPVRPGELRTAPRRAGLHPGLGRGALIAAAAALVILLAVGGGLVLLDRTDDERPVANTTSPRAPTTAMATTTEATATTSEPGVAPTALSWERLDVAMNARRVAAGPVGLVAIERTSSEALVWTSEDGADWTSRSFGDIEIDSVAYAGDRYFAFGGVWDVHVFLSADAQIWEQALPIEDGIWREGPGGDPAPGVYGAIADIAYGDGRFVAVGHVREYADGGDGVFRRASDAAVWISSDGLDWSRLPHDTAVFGGSGEQEMYEVVYGSQGFVAVGAGVTDDGDTAIAEIWLSADGITWSRREPSAVFEGQIMTDVTYGSAGYVAVGRDVFTSRDARTWAKVPGISLADGAELRDVSCGNDRCAIVGSERFADPERSESDEPQYLYEVAVWDSSDATTWSRVSDEVLAERLPSGTGIGPAAVTLHDGGVIIVGYDTLWPEHPFGEPVYAGHVWIGDVDD